MQQQYIDLMESPPTFSGRWKYKLQSQYKAGHLGDFLMEYFNYSCVERFLLDQKYERCISSSLYNMISSIDQSSPIKRQEPILEKALTPSPFGDTPDSDKFTINPSNFKQHSFDIMKSDQQTTGFTANLTPNSTQKVSKMGRETDHLGLNGSFSEEHSNSP